MKDTKMKELVYRIYEFFGVEKGITWLEGNVGLYAFYGADALEQEFIKQAREKAVA